MPVPLDCLLVLTCVILFRNLIPVLNLLVNLADLIVTALHVLVKLFRRLAWLFSGGPLPVKLIWLLVWLLAWLLVWLLAWLFSSGPFPGTWSVHHHLRLCLLFRLRALDWLDPWGALS